MRIAIELSDKEKEGDSYLNVGESYLKILNLKEALKWGRKSWETFDSIGNLEGKAHAKLIIGEVLDSSGDFEGALDAFNEGYRFALEANKSSTQLDALELINYSYMIRFDDFEKAKETKLLIEQLKQSISEEVNAKDHLGDGPDGCSETKTGLDTQSTDESSDGSFSPNTNKVNSLKSKFKDSVDDWNENIPLRSLIQSNKKKEKQRTAASPRKCIYPSQSSSDYAGRLAVSRKRVQIILSDDEAEDERDFRSSHRARNHTMEGIATSDESTRRYRSCPVPEVQDVSPVASSCAPVNLEKNTSPSKSRSSKLGSQDANFNTHAGSCNPSYSEICTLDVHSCCAEPCQHTIFKIDEKLLHVDLDLSTACGKLSMDQMKVELACLYYLQFSREKRSRGLVPVVQHMKYSGRFLESMEALYSIREYVTEKNWIEVSVGAMVSKPVIKLYIDFCEALAEPPNLKVVKTLYNLEVSDDKIIVPDCELRDVSAAPLLNALQLHSMTTVLDLSHNLLGNGTMEKLKQVFVSPGQSHLGLILNFHHNQLGPAALYHICDCPVLYARLEVLNISGNSLTDACASSMLTILQTCKALYSLDIENCSISSRTVQKVADSLHSESVLTHLYLGYNNPVSGNAMISLLRKLATLNGFQELSLSGIKLSKPVVNNLCQFAKDCCLSGLMLGNTNIGMESAIQLIKPLSKDTQELCRLDLSFCGLTRDYIFSLSNEVQLISGILELNLGGNSIMEEGSIELASLLSNPLSCLRVLVVKKCSLGLMASFGYSKHYHQIVILKNSTLLKMLNQVKLKL